MLDIWDEHQQNEFADMTDQQQYMTRVLGKQMENETDPDQQRQLDRAVKSTLVKMDDVRQDTHGLQTMNGRRHNRPPEQSTRMTEQWREMTEHSAILRKQAMESDNEEDNSEEDFEYSDTEPAIQPKSTSPQTARQQADKTKGQVRADRRREPTQDYKNHKN